MGKDKGYLKLTTSEFLDLISVSGIDEQYSISLTHQTVSGTLHELAQMALEHQNHDLGHELMPIVSDMMVARPIYKYGNLPFADIVAYVEHNTNDYNQDRVKAMFIDALQWYNNLPAIQGRKAKVTRPKPFPIGMKKVNYMIKLLNSKLPPIQNTNNEHSSLNSQINLPDKLNTERARTYFSKAIAANLISQTSNGFQWVDNIKSRLAYFCQEVFCKDDQGKDNQLPFPETELNTLFNVTRLGQSRTQLANNKTCKPNNHSDIDNLFNNNKS